MKIPKTLEYTNVLDMLAQKAVSVPGAEACRRLEPESDPVKVRRGMEHTKEAEAVYLSRDQYPLRSFQRIGPQLKRLRLGAALNAGELLALLSVMKAARHSAFLAGEEKAPYIRSLAEDLVYDSGLISRVESCILADDEIADNASPELSRIRRAIRTENEKIREKLQGMLKSKSAYLQDAIITQRSGRYVIPVKSEHKANVEGIIHERSATGATLFVEPASVVESNNRIRELEGAENAEIARILSVLSDAFRPYRENLRTNEQVLTELDILFAKASLARQMRAAPVEFNMESRLEISEGRHPLLDPETVIPVTIELEDGVRGLVVTGPNTGGKTVMLKMVGLFAAMAQAGLYLPAGRTVKMPIFDGVYADIGDDQSIAQNLSTFSAHMKSIIFAAKHAGSNSLILLDELGSGTDPQEGSALAQAVLDDLFSKGCMVIATTHIGELKDFATKRDGFENASMEWSAATLSPTYQLLMGVPGRSNALAIAKSLGLPKSIVRAAEGFMNTEAVDYARLIEAAEKERARAQKNLRKAEDLRREAHREKQKAESERKKTEEKRKKVLEKANEKALEIISSASDAAEKAIQEAKDLHRETSESARTRQTEKIRGSLKEKRSEVERHERRRQAVKPLSSGNLRPGDSVYIIPMQAPATVLEGPDRKGLVKLQAGVLTVELPLSELAAAPQSAGADQKQYLDHVNLSSRRNISTRLDLHGYTVDEAIVEVDRYLDDAFLSGLTEVAIVHGRGTGALRRGVTDYLRNHPHVKNLRTGDYNEGGIGATIVTLK